MNFKMIGFCFVIVYGYNYAKYFGVANRLLGDLKSISRLRYLSLKIEIRLYLVNFHT